MVSFGLHRFFYTTSRYSTPVLADDVCQVFSLACSALAAILLRSSRTLEVPGIGEPSAAILR